MTTSMSSSKSTQTSKDFFSPTYLGFCVLFYFIFYIRKETNQSTDGTHLDCYKYWRCSVLEEMLELYNFKYFLSKIKRYLRSTIQKL